MIKKPVIGWDIGGAHVKAVMLDSDGVIVAASQQACALWKGLPLLTAAITTVLQEWHLEPSSCDHAVTMTGELVDLFENRLQGVQSIAATVLACLPHASFYSAQADAAPAFIADVRGAELSIASMNWHASACCLAQAYPDRTVLVMDIGSTTSDITVCHAGELIPAGWTDAERMARQSLFYSGVVRTPLMALGPTVFWQGQARHIAAEYFATTADVYRVLGALSPMYDLADTADGQGRSIKESMRRLARMVGHDFEDHDAEHWHSLAQAFKATQSAHLLQALRMQAPRAQPQAIIGLGAGHFLVAELAQQLNIPYQSATTLMRAETLSLTQDAEVCFPAYAVARLWQTWH